LKQILSIYNSGVMLTAPCTLVG